MIPGGWIFIDQAEVERNLQNKTDFGFKKCTKTK
jgi:hypothetical protein